MNSGDESARKITQLQPRKTTGMMSRASTVKEVLLAKNELQLKERSQTATRYRSLCGSLCSAILISLSGIFIGFGLSQMSPIQPKIYITNWNLTFDQSWCQIMMVGIPAIAAIVGAIIAKNTVKVLSRKMNLVLSCIIVIVGSLIMLIPYEQALIIGRFLEGMGLGIQIAVSTVYLRQTAPKQLRSYFMPMLSIGITLGSLILYFISQMMTISNFDPGKQSKILVTFNGVFAISQIIGCLTIIPNSPYQLVIKGQLQDAKQEVRRIYLDQYVEQQFDIICKEIQLAKKAAQAAATSAAQRTQQDEQLLKKANRARAVAIVICLYRQLNGSNLALTFAGPILAATSAASGIQTGLNTFGPLIIMLVSFIGNVVGVFVLARIMGRKPLLIIAAITLGLTSVGAGVASEYNEPWVLFIMFVLNMFCYGAFSLAPGWTYPNEVVPADKVALQNSLTSLGLTIGVWVNPIVYNYAPNHNIFGLFYAYAVINVACLMVFIFKMVESRNRTYIEIIQKY